MSNNYETKREASIIIPTYNRKELVEFTLYSLFEQSISPDLYEVIVVDGGSTDDTTAFLSSMRTPFRLKVVRYEPNHGAAYSRNQGVKASSGEIVIFLDEMLVEEDYLAGHLKHHQTRDNLVLTSAFNGKYIFTHFFEQFPQQLKNECFRISEYPDAGWYPTNKGSVFRLFHPEQVINHSILKHGKVDMGTINFYEGLKNMHGPLLEDMAYPWIQAITNSLSMSRHLIEKVGLFDENFRKAWLEDFELGYRLFLAGATFHHGSEINSYHQTHPIGHDRNNQLENYLYFSRKFPEVEVLMCGLFCSSMELLTFHQWTKCLSQYKLLSVYGTEKYPELLKAFRDLALTIRSYALEIRKGNQCSLLDTPLDGMDRWENPFRKKVGEQINMLAREADVLKIYGDFIKAFEKLLRLPILKRDGLHEHE